MYHTEVSTQRPGLEIGIHGGFTGQLTAYWPTSTHWASVGRAKTERLGDSRTLWMTGSLEE